MSANNDGHTQSREFRELLAKIDGRPRTDAERARIVDTEEGKTMSIREEQNATLTSAEELRAEIHRDWLAGKISNEDATRLLARTDETLRYARDIVEQQDNVLPHVAEKATQYVRDHPGVTFEQALAAVRPW